MGYTKIISDFIADAVELLKRYDMINGTHSGDARNIVGWLTVFAMPPPPSPVFLTIFVCYVCICIYYIYL